MKTKNSLFNSCVAYIKIQDIDHLFDDSEVEKYSKKLESIIDEMFLKEIKGIL